MLPLLLKICHFSVVIHKIVSQIFDHSLISYYHLVTLSLIFLTLTASSALSSLFLLFPSSSSTTSASSVFISSNHFALRRQTNHFHLPDPTPPKKNIAKGTTDPRVDLISQIQTDILIKFHLQSLDQASTSKSQPNISLSIKLKPQNLDQT